MSIFTETLYLHGVHEDNSFVTEIKKYGLILTDDENLFPRFRIVEGKKEIYFEKSSEELELVGGFQLIKFWNRISKLPFSLKKEPLSKAIGQKNLKDTCLVLDMSCGTGKDTLLLLMMPPTVYACERNPILFIMLKYYFHELGKLESFPSSKLFLLFGTLDSIELPAEPDVIYFDPMYGNSANKKAAPRKQMAAFRNFLGIDEDYLYFLNKAINTSKNRVVLKKSIKAKKDESQAISHSIFGKSTRYDIYLT